MESHKSLLISLNIVGKHLAEHTDDENRARELREHLVIINRRWDDVFAAATSWQNRLQTALMEVNLLFSIVILMITFFLRIAFSYINIILEF